MSFVEVKIFGVYVAPVVPMMLAAWVILLGLRRVADRAGLLRHVWQPPLFLLAIYVVVLGASVLLAVLFSSVPIFDGAGGPLRPGQALAQDRKIGQASRTSRDGQGRALAPGLADARWHMAVAPDTMQSMGAAGIGLMPAAMDGSPGSPRRFLAGPGGALGDEAAFRATGQ